MLQQRDFDKLLNESLYKLDDESEIVSVFDEDDKKSKLLKAIDDFRSKHSNVFNRAPNVEFLGKIVDAIDQGDVQQLRSIAGMLNRIEAKPAVTNAIKDLAKVVRYIVANIDLNEDISQSLLMIAESLENKILID